jgi:hypothetical protein
LDESNFGFFNFNSSKLVLESLDGLNLKSHEYPKFITHQDLQNVFRSFFAFENTGVRITAQTSTHPAAPPTPDALAAGGIRQQNQ